MEKVDEKLVGKTVMFNARRIMQGNPVIGEVTSVSPEWIGIKLHKDIAGMNNIWEEGENKTFRIEFLSGLEIVK